MICLFLSLPVERASEAPICPHARLLSLYLSLERTSGETQTPHGRATAFFQSAGTGPAPEWFRMTRDQLQACPKKTLVDMARKKGIAGWHGMTKDQLVLA